VFHLTEKKKVNMVDAGFEQEKDRVVGFV